MIWHNEISKNEFSYPNDLEKNVSDWIGVAFDCYFAME